MIRKLLLLVKLLFTTIFTEKTFIPSLKLLCIGMFFVVSFANAATRYSVNNGNWNSTATWSTSAGGGSGASVPVAGDIVYIDGNSITVTADAACTSITFRGNINTLTINSGVSLTLATTAAGTIIYESSASSSRSATITGGGTLNCTSLTVGSNVNPNSSLSTSITSTISNLNITGNLTLDSRRSGGTVNAAFYLQSGILNLDGRIITTNEHSSNTSTFSMTSGAQSGTLLISNTAPFSLSGTGGSTVVLNGTSATVNYDGTNQTVRSTAYTNLTLSNGGTKNFTSALAIANLLSISTNTVAALGTFQHTAGVLTLGGAGPLTSSWGHTSSNPVAVNTNNTFFANNTGRITVSGAPYPAIDNNYASYGITGQITGVRGENDGALTLTAPDGSVFINVKFASYGLPGGTSPNFTIGSCHAFNSRTVTTGLLGNTSATIPASGSFNDTFGDPCYGIVKNYYVVATYAKPICSGTTPSTIIGSDPSGGNGTYSYLWEVSTTSAIAGYTTAPGVSIGRDYTIPSSISQKTWYRRTVTSGIYSDPTIVVIPVNTTSEISAPTSVTSSSSTVCSGNAITLTAVGGSFGSAGGYAEWTTGSCSGPIIGTSALPGGALTLTPTENAAYYVKFKNSCGSTTCASVSVNNPTSVTLTNTNYSTCFNSTLAQNRSITYSATTGSPTSFSIDWDTAANTAGIADRTNIANTFVATTSTINNAILVPANTPAGTYTGILTVRTGTCVSFGTTITITVNALPTPTFTAQPTASTCIGTSVTYTTQASMSNYVWGFPGTAGTDYTIVSGGATTNNIVTLKYLTAGSKTVTINYTNVSDGCTAASATSSSAVTVNALPTPTFITQPTALTCIGTSVTYTTQASMSNYVWGFPGTAGTDYTIVSGGNNTDNTVTLKYLTIGSKTVTINYTTVPNGCTATLATSSSATTVNALPTPTFDVQPSASTCTGTSVTYTTQGAMSNYVWGFPGTAGTDYTIVSGGTNADNTVTLRYLTSGSKIVSINYRNVPNSCTATSATSSTAITVNALPTTPTIGTQTDVTCTTSGSVTLNNLPGGNWTINQTGFVSNTINNTGTSYTITGLAAGTYRFTVSNGTCTSAVSSDVVITNQSSTTWSGTGWSNSIPDASKAAIIAGAFTIASDLTACSLTINPGIAITVPSNYTLTVVNALTVSPTASLTFENHSSLVQVNDNAVNSGNIKYKRIAAKIRRGDFVYWSTPVTPQKLVDVSPLTLGDKYFGYSGDNWVITNKNTVMKVGKGYIIRGPQTYSLTVKTDYPAEFNGVPNNGVILGETLTAGKPYLIGNPYPSALSAKKFLDQNTALLEGTLYFWTHNTPVTLTGVSTYTTDDYASYNLTGSTVVKERAISGGTPGNNNEEPSGFIGAGQSFFAMAKAGGTVTFNNDMRLGAADNTQFFKSASKETAQAHHVWLNMTNTQGVFKQMLVGYVQGATNEYEDRYDGVSFNANPYVDFYSVDNGNNYVIQGRALPFTDADQVPLGYNTTIAGDFTISIDKADGDLSSHAVYIEDKKSGVIHDLTASDYTFTTEKGIFADRLVLRYTNKTLGTGDFENTENGLLVSVKEKTIKVTSSAENIKEVTVFDISGKLLYSKKKAGTTELQIQNLQSANQVLLVKVTLDNDFTTTKKIIFN